MAKLGVAALVLLGLLQGCTPFDWDSSLPDRSQLTVCTGQDVQLAWDYTRGSANVMYMDWSFIPQDSGNKTTVAFSVNQQFSVSQGIHETITPLSPAGITIHGVSLNNTGNYSVHVSSIDHGALTEHYSSVYLSVIESFQLEAGALTVVRRERAQLDNATGDWHVQLVCGTFLSRGSPPVDVQWMLPDGSVANSSSADSEHFFLNVPNPVQSGNYSCHVITDVNSTCAAGRGRDSDPVVLSALQSRLTVMEARLETLEQIHTPGGQLSDAQSVVSERSRCTQDDLVVLHTRLSEVSADNRKLQDLMEVMVTKMALLDGVTTPSAAP